MKISNLIPKILICALATNGALHSDPMNVTATVIDTCQINAVTDTNFGAISGLFQLPVTTATGSISITCTLDLPYTLNIDAGSNANSVARRMTDGSVFIQYGLFQDPGRSTTWGDGTSFGSPLSDTGDGLPHTFPIYAAIPAGQTPVGPGLYSDIVTVTFNF